MTKLRPPLSIENALYKVLGDLGIECAAGLLGKEKGYLHSLTDQDTRFRLTCDDAIILDDHYAALLGARPIHETMGLMLDARSATRFADMHELQRMAAPVIREAGEAHAAMVAATLPGAGQAELSTFIREAEEAVAEITRAMAAAKAMLTPRQQPP